MALVRHSADHLLAEAKAGQLSGTLTEQARHQWGHRPGQSEIDSWARSLGPFLADLVDAGLGAVEVLLEHKLPHSPKRVDALLCGVHPRTGEASYVLVELKQWSKAELLAADLVRIASRRDPVLHPVEQVRRYCEYLVDSTPALADRPNAVHGIAYLHNADAAGVSTLRQYQPSQFGALFTMDDKAKLADRLRSLLDPAADRDAARRSADEFLGFEHAPTKPLLDLAAREIQEREQFVLLDEQQVAVEVVMQAVERAKAAATRTVVVVLGGPGSGKSVIALSLLGELARRGRRVHHATGSSAFTNTMRRIAGRRNRRVQTLFKYFNDYMESEARELDVLICDEAHRVRETSVKRYTPRRLRERAGRQIDELINVASVPVFLLDENQTVRPGEMGSLAEITAAAESRGCRLEVVRLSGQFRCGGSDAFDMWVARLLGLDRLPPVPWSRLGDDFVVASAATPAGLDAWLRQRMDSHGGTGRLSAGYCWRWSDPESTPDGRRLVEDVVIGGWRRPWNAKPGQRVPDAPESYYWASDERGFGQVGCIYTAQGFEYDWSGVIFGPDLVRRDGRWIARREHSHDPAAKKADDLEFGRLVRNTYKVLLTRGMRGTCVYSTDPETQAFLEEMAG
ncbi:DNA/RNA helicase domain-containing protein [Amycolatopsis thermoflava]|uniref:DNA/RNA helicase domain-containing protein n=1 Tax=Amycolatopsis thermoflava TaxID=84480 RepID=UPI000416B625|nr:DNA/RNA helicase domain-containing protein [Amycolatopsis thermoflava]